jgi:hypothetical protein
MSTLLDDVDTSASSSPAQRLRTQMAAVRVSLSWFGVRKTLTPEQKAQAAATFAAEGDYLSAAKRLLDTTHPAYKAVTTVKNNAVAYWKSVSLPFPEQGIRLIRQDRVEAFVAQMGEFQEELDEAVRNLDQHYSDLRQAARDRLGTLYNSADYPDSLAGMFAIEHDFPSVEAPDYLRQLNPQLYEQECQRIQDRFNEAVQLAEEGFIGELAKIVSHLTERLSGQADGKPKVFRDSAVDNLVGFFERFRELNVRSSEQLDALVADAQQIVRGIGPQDLRDNQQLRQHVVTKLSGVQSVLDGLLVDRPRRNILRRPK